MDFESLAKLCVALVAGCHVLQLLCCLVKFSGDL